MNRPKDNTLYDHLVKYHADPLIPVKFQFFKDVVDMLSPYLQRFQTDAPMMPFVFGALEEVAETNTAHELVCIDLNDKENQLLCELNKLPTATKSLLSSTVASDKSKLRFKADCGSILKIARKIAYKVYLCPIACFILKRALVSIKKSWLKIYVLSAYVLNTSSMMPSIL